MGIDRVRIGVAALGLCGASVSALGQYVQDFDGLLNGYLTGQDGFFIPVAGSLDFSVANYNDAGLFNIPQNPTGGSKCIVGHAFGGFARAERAFDWSASDHWLWAFDVYCVNTTGNPQSNAGSVSVQPFGAAGTPLTRGFINLLYFDTNADPGTDVDVAWTYYRSDGTTDGGFYNPDDARQTWPDGPFSDMRMGRWYRVEMNFAFSTGRIYRMAVRDLSTGSSCDEYFPTVDDDWHIAGGATQTAPNGTPLTAMPTAFRFFTGGGTTGEYGNLLAYDNVAFVPQAGPPEPGWCPSGCPADFNDDGFLDFFDLDAYIACFEGEGCPDGKDADFNGDGFIDFFDADAYLEAFELGCGE
ncbi:MAG: hypothetical protein HRU70_10065 [Phycisphaeraceae bacterium]|nr:MAG: hypothetical protein HRU70_10065 [Phycisphaeraceae bacterium]